MNTQVFLEEFSASNDHIIVKGKRTKRPRLSSSADFNSLPSSPASSSGISTSTEEDEDLANCLILLARGGLAPQSQNKFGSRKFTEMASTATGKVSIYLYECKTCSRTFPSFQALGGHRASHKKPKTAADCDQRRSTPPPPPKNQVKEEEDTIAPPPSTPQRLGHVENKPKIHECSICGSEFASGQALGGHMRRHRSAPTAAPLAVAAKSDENDDGDSSSHNHDRHVVEKTRKILSLDLNLPAPAEEEFRAFSSKQQPRLMFAAAALVDCHY